MLRHLLLSCSLFACAVQAQQTNVLFIGNSYVYSNDLPNMLRQLALSLGDTVLVSSVAPGGFTFEQHSSNPATLEAIASQAWDHVVLQEQSQRPAFSPEQVQAQVFPYAAQLVQAIRANADCTMPVFYMTWGRRDGDAGNCAVWPPVCTFQGMNDLLRERYVQMAEDNDAHAAPVGAAWATVRAQQPTLDLYVSDGSHPSVAGTYLAACTFYSTLFGVPCTGATYLAGLSPATAATLQQIASSTVLNTPTDWNLDLPSGAQADFTTTSTTATTVTFGHPATSGTHAWTCTNGESATTPNATFTVVEGSTYTVQLVYTNACGDRDTATVAYTHAATGLPEHAAFTGSITADVPGILTARDVVGTLIILDAQGRTLSTERLAGGTVHLPCTPGLRAWRLHTPHGERTGKVVVR